MELLLDLPAGWAGSTGAVLELGPFAPLPDEPRRWVEAVMTSALPAGARVEKVDELAVQNDLGWPMECAAAMVLGPDGMPVEERLGAFFKLNEWVTFAVARGPSLEGLRETLMAAFRSGRPRWQSPTVIAAISELWS